MRAAARPRNAAGVSSSRPSTPTSSIQAPTGVDLAHIGDALDELAAVDPELAQIVDLKFFCGFSFAEIAAMRGVSERTVQRHWEKARICLHRTVRDASLD